jgi:CRISPR-associated protein Cmr2
MSSALFTFTIGPVKSFVESGRKMRDLYAGSVILSEIMSYAVDYLEEKEGIQRIFPKFDETLDKERMKSFPNRLVAYVDVFEQVEHKQMAEELTTCVKHKFQEICKDAFKELNPETELKIAYKQLENFLEIYWMFEEYGDNYSDTYQNLFMNTHALKSIRPFIQTTELWGRKCTLHPEYNAIFVKKTGDNFPYNTNGDHIIDITSEGKLTYTVKPKEAMSALALVKRLYSQGHDVSLRNMVLKKRLGITENESLFPELFSVENHGNKNIEKITHIVNALYDLDNELTLKEEDYPKEVIAEAKKLKEHIKKIRLTSYYVVLKFDGDSMGDKYLELESEEEHTKLSKEICAFAIKARTIIEKAGGICIYAGGEDILAAMPIEQFWETLKQLHIKFYEVTNMTFSAGIVIAHLMQPLKDVMNEVVKAEKYAKDNLGKNTFAVSLMKRASETRTFRYRFDNDGYYKSLCIYQDMIELLNKGQDSKSTVHKINNILQLLLDKENTKLETKMIESLVRQSINSGKVKNKEEFIENILHLYKKSGTLNNFMNTLDIGSFLAGEVKLHVE